MKMKKRKQKNNSEKLERQSADVEFMSQAFTETLNCLKLLIQGIYQFITIGSFVALTKGVEKLHSLLSLADKIEIKLSLESHGKEQKKKQPAYVP